METAKEKYFNIERKTKMKRTISRKITARLLSVILILSIFFSTGVFAANAEADTADIGVQYRGHVQNKGDFPIGGTFITGPDELGTRGEGLRLEGVYIELTGDVPAGAGISYEVHVQNEGWMDPVQNGILAGTTSKSLRIESIKINLIGLDGYDVYYRGHVQNHGDVPYDDNQWGWVKNGAELGTTGEGLRLEAIEIKIVKTINDVSLGDSIAYGMSATPGSGYVDLFYDHLSGITGNEDLSLINLGIPGADSSDLLYQLQNDPATISDVGNAKVITISIGGNNLLAPVIATMATAFNLDPTSPTFATDLAVALADPGAQAIINASLPALQTNLAAGALQFVTDWPTIIGTVRTLAPQAEIYVATLYNPINQADPMYQVFAPVIQQINSVIMAPNSGYKVADVYSAFSNYKGTDPLVYFNWYTGNLDPHPTTMGHSVIYQTHLNAQLITSSQE